MKLYELPQRWSLLIPVVTLAISCTACNKSNSKPGAEDYNRIISTHFKDTRFVMSKGYYQPIPGGKSYFWYDSTKDGLIKSLAFSIGKDNASNSFVYSINKNCSKINSAYLPDSTVKIPIDLSVRKIYSNVSKEEYLGMQFLDFSAAENNGIGYINKEMPVITYKIFSFVYSQSPNGSNLLNITLQQMPAYTNTFLDLVLTN